MWITPTSLAISTACLLALVTLVGPSAPAAQPTPNPSATASPAHPSEAQQLVFLLQYVGSDYGAAVKDGVVVDQAEYRENEEFAKLILERFVELRPTMPPGKLAALESALRRLQELVSARADARLVKEVAEAAIPLAVEALGLRSFPRERPNPRLASRLYAENCVPCHGGRGGGDGPRAKEFQPRPARFSDATRMNTAAPYLFYNAITLGVPNTAMASFSESLSDQQRWDLAFYLWTFAPSAAADARIPALGLSLRDLATRSSADLAPEVVRQTAAHGQSIDPATALAWLARLRADPPSLSDPQEQLARLRNELEQSVVLVERGDVDSAADLVTNAYLTEFEPLEAELDRRDPRVRQTFERDLIQFRAALRSGDRPGALATVKTLEETVGKAERLLGPSGAEEGSGNHLLLALLLAAVALAGGALVRWIGKETAAR
jgi:high-affinity iron transporter